MDFIEAASTIGSKLCRNAIWANDRCNWVAPFDNYHQSRTPRREYRPLAYDVYEGCAGAGYFLSSLYRITADEVFKSHAIGALKNSLFLFNSSGTISQSFFAGKSGIATVLIKSGVELKNEELFEDGVMLLKTLTVPGSDIDTDVIAGAAGIILSLSWLKTEFNVTVDDEYLHKLGHFLLKTARKENTGISWKTSENQKYNLTGFAHGNAGIATALLKLYELYGNDDFLQAALAAIAFEDALYSEQAKNWPDLRTISDVDFYRRNFNFSNAWCHGAPGIGFSRLYFYRILGSQYLLKDIDAAIATTIAGLKSLPNYSLCHGLAGNLDFLIEANKILNDPGIDDLIAGFSHDLCTKYLQYHLPVPSGLSDSAETPGLMLGIAGTGYFLLRCTDPFNLRSVLMLG